MLVFPLREAELLEPKTLKLTHVINAITETGSNAKGTVVEAPKCHAFILDIPLVENGRANERTALNGFHMYK